MWGESSGTYGLPVVPSETLGEHAPGLSSCGEVAERIGCGKAVFAEVEAHDVGAASTTSTRID